MNFCSSWRIRTTISTTIFWASTSTQRRFALERRSLHRRRTLKTSVDATLRNENWLTTTETTSIAIRWKFLSSRSETKFKSGTFRPRRESRVWQRSRLSKIFWILMFEIFSHFLLVRQTKFTFDLLNLKIINWW